MLFRRLVQLVALTGFVMFTPFSASAAPIAITEAYTDAQGRVWAQVIDTLGLSWTQLSTVCPGEGNACTDDLTVGDDEYQLESWVWASVDDVRGLFNEFLAPYGISPLGSSFTESPASGWALDFLSIFNPRVASFGGLTTRAVNGLTVTTTGDGTNAFVPFLSYLSSSFGGTQGFASVTAGHFLSSPHPDIGAWLYKDATTEDVPEPAALMLLGVGLVALRVRRMRTRP